MYHFYLFTLVNNSENYFKKTVFNFHSTLYFFLTNKNELSEIIKLRKKAISLQITLKIN